MLGSVFISQAQEIRTNPGRYYIWVRALGTDGDDNTLHFGMDGQWPTNSVRMHHDGGGKWGWACRHRQHKGRLYLDVANGGPHVINLSMREDGCEVDRFILTTNENFVAPIDSGPVVMLKSGTLPDLSVARFSARSDGHMIDQIVLRRIGTEPFKDTPGETLP